MNKYLTIVTDMLGMTDKSLFYTIKTVNVATLSVNNVTFKKPSIYIF